MDKLMNFLRDEEGATAIEYGLIVGLIAVVIILVLTQVGTGLKTLFTRVDSGITNAANAP